MTSEAEGPMVDLRDLLSGCVTACVRGCREVQAWALTGDTRAELKDPGDIRSYVTQADLASQAAIVASLVQEWPELRIVGEEDGAEPQDKIPKLFPPEALLNWRLEGLGSEEMLVPLAEVTVLVDPVDGTRELVEGRLGAVQTLVGVTVRGRAVAGAVGLPFPGDGDMEPVVEYGLVGSGYGTVRAWQEVPGGTGSPPAEQDTGLLYTSGDSKNPSLAAAKEVLVGVSEKARTGAEWRLMGGAGNKLLAAAQGRVAAALMHTGTSLWDTCAPEAVVRARGGEVTDLFGAPIKYFLDRGSGGLINQFGVLGLAPGFEVGWGAAPRAVWAGMRACPQLLQLLSPYTGAKQPPPPQASDVARDLQGLPLTTAWLQDQLSQVTSSSCRLVSYSAPEAEASRDLMSDVCRLHLEWDTPGLPSSVFYKRVVIGDLEHARMKAKTAPLKLARDVKSYTVEAEFLGSDACSQLVAAGIPVARAYSVQREICRSDPIESRFAILLEDFAPSQNWRQHRLLSAPAIKATLAAFAKIHGFFWRGSSFWQRGGGAAEQLESAVWQSGSYWQPSMQPPEQLDQVANAWERHREAFGLAFSEAKELTGIDLTRLGQRLQAVVHRAGQSAHPFNDPESSKQYNSWRTLIHGDAKSANIFLRESEESQSQVQVGLIDFQWCGFGLAATEVAHHILAAVDMESLSYDGSKEAELLDHYYSHLLTALVEFGAAEDRETAAGLLTRECLQDQYEVAILDMCRTVFAYHWVRIKASPAVLEKNKLSLGRNSYNKSLAHAKWLVAACHRALNYVEQNGILT